MTGVMDRLLKLVGGSVTLKLLLLGVVFLVVPAMLYGRFAEVDAQRQQLLVRNLQIQGRLVAQSLEATLTAAGPRAVVEAGQWVERFAQGELRIKLLLRPAADDQGFYYVAASPQVGAEYLTQERDRLVQSGVLPKLEESCAGNRPLADRFTNPSGEQELLTSITPFHTEAGCWAVITSYAASDLAGDSLTRPFADAPEVRWAGGFYVFMALLILASAIAVSLSLRRFADLARRIRRSQTARGVSAGVPRRVSFAAASPVPELKPVAVEFDRMVATLDASARTIREAAEENAHAFKAPIAAIAQSLEPLRRTAKDPLSGKAVTVIERSLDRLEALISAARRVDEAIAELLDEPVQFIALSSLVRNTARAFNDAHSGQSGNRVAVVAEAADGIRVGASEEALETVLENLLDNAVSFSPPGGVVRIKLSKANRRAEMVVEDQGPGVPNDIINHIFERHFSYRPNEAGDTGDSHFGIGLAIVRRNVELLGGTIVAENRAEGGLRITVKLPLADKRS